MAIGDLRHTYFLEPGTSARKCVHRKYSREDSDFKIVVDGSISIDGEFVDNATRASISTHTQHAIA